MNYGRLIKYDVTNGPGVRTTLFVSGCTHKCPGCFNEEQQNFKYGKEFTEETRKEMIVAAKNSVVVGVSILGGEPMQQFKDPTFLGLLYALKSDVKKPIWVWTGYRFEELLKNKLQRSALDFIDVIIDGLFEEDKEDLMLKYRGSSNQRVIDVKESLKQNKVVELDI